MHTLTGTETEKRLLLAFAGESQARNRYDFFAEKAGLEGLPLIREIFLETAHQEQAHARRWFNFLEGGKLEICGVFPSGVLRDATDNLQLSIATEHEEYSQMYPQLGRTAEAEGFSDIARAVRGVISAEEFHEARFQKMLKNAHDASLLAERHPGAWRCRNCGCLAMGGKAPEACPACAYPQEYFMELNMRL